MAIVYVGINLAKNVFTVHGTDEAGKPAPVRPSVARGKLHEPIASLSPRNAAMEACTGVHHWARLFAAHDHTVRPIAPKFVTPYHVSGVRGISRHARITKAGDRCHCHDDDRRAHGMAVPGIGAAADH